MKEKVILQTMTGDEFKKYIEQRNPNGEIDTLPEVLKALKGLRDDETIKDYLDRMSYEAHLPQEEREMIEQLLAIIENGEEITEEEIEDDWQEALRNAGLDI